MSTLAMSASISSNVQVSTNEWMRSREPMGKWYWHFGQTLRFSSSSLSKIIVSHVGHLVQSPSGISRFLVFDLPVPSLGLRVNVGDLPVGGVKAGSTVSMPSSFFVNVVVSMSHEMLVKSNPARNCPDADHVRARLTQYFGTGAGRRTRGKHIVNDNDPCAGQLYAIANAKSPAHIGRALLFGQPGLGHRGRDAAEQADVQRNVRGVAQMPGETFGLVEFAFALLYRMQRHRHDEIPVLFAQHRLCLADQQVGEERFKPERVREFVTMDGFQHDGSGGDGGTRGAEVQFHLTAVRALKRRGQIAGVGQAAAFAERRTDEAHLRPATRANEAILLRRPFRLAKLADFGIEKAEAGVEPAFDRCGERGQKAQVRFIFTRYGGVVFRA